MALIKQLGVIGGSDGSLTFAVGVQDNGVPYISVYAMDPSDRRKKGVLYQSSGDRALDSLKDKLVQAERELAKLRQDWNLLNKPL